MDLKHKNALRFTGFADIYDNARPCVPEYPVKILCNYLQKSPKTVVDLGCGTGLSTKAWFDKAENIIGIEPSQGMIDVAKKIHRDNVKFIQAFSDDIPLNDNCADIVTASQSFHWMEPTSTLKEVDRILKENGIFATIDCDWPPVTLWQAEKAYAQLNNKVKYIEKNTKKISDSFTFYKKEDHLKNIQNSGYFRYCREILFCNKESCTAQRFLNIILSQGSLQEVFKNDPALIKNDIDDFAEKINDLYGDSVFDIEFCYRMRIGIK